MRWLFVMGVALEATGAILIVFPTLRGIAVPSRRSEELDSIEAGAMGPHAYVLAGAVLLFVGFLVQFAGYLWQFWAWYFLVVPLLGASVVGFAAAQIADRRLPGWLQNLSRAERNFVTPHGGATEAETDGARLARMSVDEVAAAAINSLPGGTWDQGVVELGRRLIHSLEGMRSSSETASRRLMWATVAIGLLTAV